MKEIVLGTCMLAVTICTYTAYIPQIYRLLKTKHSEDLSKSSWVLWGISASLDTFYSIVLGRWELILAAVSELVMILLTLGLTVKYERKYSTIK